MASVLDSRSDWPCAALRRAELARKTTMRVGGRVELLLEPATPEELRDAWCACRELGVVPRLLGGGANVVIADGVLPGVVIATERMRRLFRPLPADEAGPLDGLDADARVAPADPAADPRLVAWAGATLPALLRAARDLGYAGLEGLAGVPGNVGGGVTMNAGGRWGDLWDRVELVRVLDPEGNFRDRTPAEVGPRYRDGNLGGAPVVGAVFRFEVDHRLRIKERMDEYLRVKNTTQPVTEPSAGCIFKNPDPELSGGRSAGRLVEESGAKGFHEGDALVSPKHGNFIVNRGNASATQVLTLMDRVRDHVAQRTGVELRFEVQRWLPVEDAVDVPGA